MALELNEEMDGRILVVRVTGKLVAEDYEVFMPMMDRLVQKRGKINILFEMCDFHGWTTGAMWQDTKFAIKHFRAIDRLAVIGEKKWQKGMTTFCKPFTKAEVRYFEHSQADEARTWLQQEPAAAAK